jgi:nicotinate-nucleotide adenylyltransferase
MRIGILGGTFDPPHIGHLTISLEAIKRFQLKKVIWLITRKNPLKKNNLSNDVIQRIKLCNEFIIKNKNIIDVQYIEEKTKSNFLIDNIKYVVNKSLHNEYYFIMGADSFVRFDQWKKYNEILSKLSIIVINRPDFSIKSLNSVTAKKLEKYKSLDINLKNKQRHRWYFLNTKGMNVSSSKIKKTINEN